jgi:putative pyrroloquinoline-quinone binding quinoprotein
LTTDPASRTKCRDAWADWWKEQGHTVDLAKAEAVQRILGLTLVVDSVGRVVELDPTGKIRWKIEGLAGPLDAQMLPGQRVLIAEQNASRVTERDLTGKILWEKTGLVTPFVAQRLRNGNTFIGCRNSLHEVDKTGKLVWSQPRPQEYLMAATKLRDGQIAYVNNAGQYVRLTGEGKEVKRYQIAFNPNWGMNNVAILPNDNVLVSVQGIHKVTEYSPDGKTVWEATIPHAGIPFRLSNGHTLVPNVNNLRIAELDRSGKLVSEWKDLPVRPWRVTRR